MLGVQKHCYEYSEAKPDHDGTIDGGLGSCTCTRLWSVGAQKNLLYCVLNGVNKDVPSVHTEMLVGLFCSAMRGRKL